MQHPGTRGHTDIRYQPDETPPLMLTAGLGLQLAILCIAGVVLTPAIVIRAAGGSEGFLSWAVFAAVAVSGLTTVLQAVRVGRFGAGHVLLMGTSGAFIAVCVTALVQGGPALLATLVLVSSFFQFILSSRLSLLRRILTPAVAGTVLMLIPVTVMPIIFDMLGDVPKGTPAPAAPLSALVTVAVILCIALKATGFLRLWAPVIGVVVGSVVAGGFGLYNTGLVANAAWVGLPDGAWPGLDLGFGATFWALLPAFVFVTLVGAIETIGDGVAIQRVSWRGARAVDFRTVEGAVAADGVGNLLSGLAATVPNTTYSSSIAITELTGVAARSVGVWIGVVFIVAAFLPKAAAVLLAIPAPVAAAYITVLLAMLFVLGMRMIVRDGADARKAVIVGVSFWVGVGFQNQVIFADQLGEFWGTLLGNGMTTGGLTAMVLTGFLNFTSTRSRRVRTTLDADAVPQVVAFLRAFAEARRWAAEAADRLCAAGEEALHSLLAQHEAADQGSPRDLLLTARSDGHDAELEFVAATGGGNVEDNLLLLSERPEQPEPHELSLRLLRHYASSVHHQQYHGTDIVTVHVSGRGAALSANDDTTAETG